MQVKNNDDPSHGQTEAVVCKFWRFGIWDSKKIQVEGGGMMWTVPVDILSTTALGGS